MENKNISWLLRNKGDIQATERTRRLPKPNEVELAIRATGICGSDVHFWVDGRMGEFIVEEPMVLGHESCGIVTGVGENCTTLKVGDQVAIEPGVPCYICNYCKSGRYNLCEDMKFAATPPCDGTLCQYYYCPEDFCVKLPPEFPSLEQGALIEPLSVGIHACTLANLKFGQTVIIFGAGPVGLLTGAAARSSGAVKITMVDINQHRLNFAKSYVADEIVLGEEMNKINSIEDSKRFSRKMIHELDVKQADVVFECSGVECSAQTGIYMTKPGGTFVQVGMGKDDVTLPLSDITIREITVRGSFRYCNTYKKAVEMVTAGSIKLGPLITHKFKFEECVRAFETVRDRRDNVIKALILGVEKY